MNFISDRSKLSRTSPPEMRREFLHNTIVPGDDLLNMGGLPSTSSGPLLSPPLVASSKEDPLAGALLGLSEMITRLVIVHPCAVIRRQCQVHQGAASLHLTPVTLVPVICNLVGQQGISTLWRGSIGSGVLYAMASATDIIVADLFGLPRHVTSESSSSKLYKHYFLKATTHLLMTPFYVSSFIETIRSSKGLVGGEDNRAMEVITKAFDRLRFSYSGRDTSRRFSILHLAVPSVIFHTSHYAIQSILYRHLYRMAKGYVARKPVSERTRLHEFTPQLFAQMSSTVLTDLILFPFETVMHRMFIQGTRTIIDDMDNGVMAVSMKVKYDGFLHCLRSIVESEGFWALYAGIGAVVLEYGLQSLLHQLVRACFDRGTEVLRRAKSTAALPPSAPPLAPAPSTLSPRTVASPTRPLHEYPSFGEMTPNDPLAQFAHSTSKTPLFLRTDTRDPFGPQ